MITEADWQPGQPADLKPYVQAALELFGPDRWMFGSDWPVCELAGTYEQVYYALVDALGPISDAERAAIFGGTAMRFYGLQPRRCKSRPQCSPGLRWLPLEPQHAGLGAELAHHRRRRFRRLAFKVQFAANAKLRPGVVDGAGHDPEIGRQQSRGGFDPR